MAARAGADAIGLVAAMPSGPGPIPDDQIVRIAATVPDGVMSVLLTSRTDPDGVVDHVQRTGVRAVQLVDRVEDGVIPALRAACPEVTVIEVIHVRDEADFEQAMRSDADHLLLDSGAPDAEIRELGGTGRVHDWTVSARIVAAAGKPVWLAGGLHPGNVAQAIRSVRPFGVDLCSGLRPQGGLNTELLADFMAEVARA